MIVACTSCGAKYRYEESRFEGKASKKIRCTKCQTVFEVLNPQQAESSPVVVADNPPPVLGNDSTFTRRPAAGEEDSEDRTKEYVVRPAPPAVKRAANLKLPVGRKFSLAIISGPDSGKTYPVEKPRVVIGRAGADISLSDPEISRNHAAVEFEEEQVTLVDLNSTNGTFVNGAKIQTSALENYGEFEVGSTTLMLIVTGA